MPDLPRTRHDGWTPERQAIFLATLRITRSVSRAATAAGISRKSAYAFRSRAAGQLFARAWDRALEPSLAGFNQALDQGDKGHSQSAPAAGRPGPKVTSCRPAKVTGEPAVAKGLSAVNPGQARLAAARPTA